VFRNEEKKKKKSHSFAGLSASIKFRIKCKYLSQFGGAANTAGRSDGQKNFL
jgi:hypothetical protein